MAPTGLSLHTILLETALSEKDSGADDLSIFYGSVGADLGVFRHLMLPSPPNEGLDEKLRIVPFLVTLLSPFAILLAPSKSC